MLKDDSIASVVGGQINVGVLRGSEPVPVIASQDGHIRVVVAG